MAEKPTIEWFAVKAGHTMWNVYSGDDYRGYVARREEGWVAWDSSKDTFQRAPRASAALSAADMWGEEAGGACR